MSAFEDAFLAIFPVLHLLLDTGHHRVWERVDGCLLHTQPGPKGECCDPVMIEELRAYIQEPVNTLREAIDDERLLKWNPEFRQSYSEALELLTEMKTHEQLALAEELLNDSLESLNDIVRTYPEAIFGERGAALFWLIIDMAAGSLEYKSVERAVQAIRQAEVADFSVLKNPSPIQLNEATFSVRIGERTPCFLGNSKPYRLLDALARSPNRFIQFLDLATAIGGDANDFDALPVTKCRLAKRLRQEGYDDLAKSIRTQPGHYGLFLADSAIQM